MKAEISKIESTLRRLRKKDPVLFRKAVRKIAKISGMDPVAVSHFKNLRSPLSHLKRVHIGSFVLIFRVIGEIVVFESLTHHDDAYA